MYYFRRISGTPLWDELEEEDFDETEFVDLFARQVVQPKKKEKKEDKPVKVKVNIIQFMQLPINCYFVFFTF